MDVRLHALLHKVSAKAHLLHSSGPPDLKIELLCEIVKLWVTIS